MFSISPRIGVPRVLEHVDGLARVEQRHVPAAWKRTMGAGDVGSLAERSSPHRRFQGAGRRSARQACPTSTCPSICWSAPISIGPRQTTAFSSGSMKPMDIEGHAMGVSAG